MAYIKAFGWFWCFSGKEPLDKQPTINDDTAKSWQTAKGGKWDEKEQKSESPGSWVDNQGGADKDNKGHQID
jgi:hypothetical protein